MVHPQITPTLLVEAGYAASHGVHLPLAAIAVDALGLGSSIPYNFPPTSSSLQLFTRSLSLTPSRQLQFALTITW